MSDKILAGDAEDRKLKRKRETKHEEETEDHLLTLRLCSYYNMDEVSRSSSGTRDSSSSAPKSVGVAVDPSPRRPVFICRICKKEFYSSQSLGGHQNAHRQRDQTKLSKGLQSGGLSLGQLASPFYPNLSPMANLPFLGESPPSYLWAHMHQHHTLTHSSPVAGAMSWPRHGYGYVSELLNSPHSANLYGLRSSYGTAAPGGFLSPSSLAIPNANQRNLASATNIGGLEENRHVGNHQQQSSATATATATTTVTGAAGEGQGIDFTPSMDVRRAADEGEGQGQGQELDLSLRL